MLCCRPRHRIVLLKLVGVLIITVTVISVASPLLPRFAWVSRVSQIDEYKRHISPDIATRRFTERSAEGDHDGTFLVYSARNCMENASDKCEHVLVPVAQDKKDEGSEQLTCRNVSSSGPPPLSFPICFYTSSTDWYISGALSRGQMWEPDFIRQMAGWLQADPRYGLIDIGANIGTYSLAAAHLGHKVVAVEPLSGNLQRLKRSIMLGRINRNVTIVEAGIGDSRTSSCLRVGRTNKGDIVAVDKEACLAVNRSHHTCDPMAPIQVIYMDDLLPVIGFTKAVLKIDIEGYEMKAFAHAQKIFEQINITHVIMEWTTYKWPEHNNSESARKEVEAFIDFFIRRGYKPHTPELARLTNPSWVKWPNDVIWMKKDEHAHQ